MLKLPVTLTELPLHNLLGVTGRRGRPKDRLDPEKVLAEMSVGIADA
jgi:hypothetical protein